jgi:octaprenyl-diphosphate synthase
MVTTATAAPAPGSAHLIQQLGHVCRDRGLGDLASRLLGLQRFIHDDLRSFEAELEVLPRGARIVQRSADHLLSLGGKHLRPMCVALASRFGAGFGDAARELAMAVELVHSATLLHDDVVDLGEVRRGEPTARMIYGNAASIFAGDWLLVQALRRVRRAGVPGLLDRMLEILDEMILAESLQLEQRGRVTGDVGVYFRVVEGKTAALFRWAMLAGGRAGGLADAECAALERYGLHLGVAFQVVDDYLDFCGDSDVTGKSMYADLREGKATYPLLLAMARDPELAPLLGRALAGGDAVLPPAACAAIAGSLERTGALRDTRALAAERVERAVAELELFGESPAKAALITVAEATLHREK